MQCREGTGVESRSGDAASSRVVGGPGLQQRQRAGWGRDLHPGGWQVLKSLEGVAADMGREERGEYAVE